MAKEQKNAVGRPTKYNNQIIECAKAYLHGAYKEQGNRIPTAAGLAFALGVTRGTVYEWAGSHPEFSDILEGIATAQEMLLIDGGLIGDFNPTITKLILTKHGYSDKQEVDNKSSDGSMTPAPTVIQLVTPDDDSEDYSTEENTERIQ